MVGPDPAARVADRGSAGFVGRLWGAKTVSRDLTCNLYQRFRAVATGNDNLRERPGRVMIGQGRGHPCGT